MKPDPRACAGPWFLARSTIAVPCACVATLVTRASTTVVTVAGCILDKIISLSDILSRNKSALIYCPSHLVPSRAGYGVLISFLVLVVCSYKTARSPHRDVDPP